MAFIPHAGSAEKGTPHSRVTFLIGAVNEAAPGIAAVAAGFANLTAIGMRTAAEMTSGMRVVEAGFMAVGAASALALGVATAEAMKFEKQMKMVQAVSNDMTNQQITAMSNQIKALSIKYGEAPAETAEAMQTLGRAGIKDATAQMAIFESAMKMAKIEGMDLADALDAVVKTTALFGSNMEDSAQFAKDAAKMTEYMVHASQISPTDVADIQQGLTYVGGAAKEVGWSPQETMSAIAYMAQKGVSGSIAGTSIRGLLTKSVGDQPKYQKAAARLGLDPGFAWTKDAQGREIARPLWEIVQMVRTAARAKGMGEREQFELWNAIGMQKTAQQMLKINPAELKAFDEEMQKSFDLQAKVDKAMESASVKWDKFTAAVTVLAINIGEKLLPMVGVILDKLAAFAGWIAQSSIATTAFAMLLGGGVIVGAAVVLRWLSVAARWVWTEFMAITRSTAGLSGYLAGLIGTTEGATAATTGFAGAMQAGTIAVAEQNAALEMNNILKSRMYSRPIGPNPATPMRSGAGMPAPIYPTSRTQGLKTAVRGSGLGKAGAGALSMLASPEILALLGVGVAFMAASAVQDSRNVATHNDQAIKNTEARIDAYTKSEKRLRGELEQLNSEQKKYTKGSAEWNDLANRITGKEIELAGAVSKKDKAVEKAAKNQEELTRWTENAAIAHQNMITVMSEPLPVPKPGANVPNIAPDEETPKMNELLDISTRTYKTQETVWNKFSDKILKRREDVSKGGSDYYRFLNTGMGKGYNADIEASMQKETEIWLRTMGIDPATGKPFEAGQYGTFDWMSDYIMLGVQKSETMRKVNVAKGKASEYNLETGQKKSWWEQLFGVRRGDSMSEINKGMSQTQSIMRNRGGRISTDWRGTTQVMGQNSGLFKTNTQNAMNGAASSTATSTANMSTSLYSLQNPIASVKNWLLDLWNVAKYGESAGPQSAADIFLKGAENATNRFAINSGQPLTTNPFDKSAATSYKGILPQPTTTQNQPVLGPSSPVRIWNKGTPRYAAGAIEFPDLNPDLFKKRAVETGEALGAGKGGGVQIGTLIVNANTKNDAKYIAETVRAELKKVAESV